MLIAYNCGGPGLQLDHRSGVELRMSDATLFYLKAKLGKVQLLHNALGLMTTGGFAA